MNPRDITGTWTNVSLLVTMKRFEQQDSILKAEEGEWEEVLKIKPIITTFNADSTYSSQYFTLEGQNFYTDLGNWWIRNDSLVMLNEQGESTYHFEIKNNRVRFKAYLDWDQDGERDDHYDAVQIKLDSLPETLPNS